MATRHSPKPAWRTKQMEELFEAIASLENYREVEDFFRDLCTLGELEAMAHRWEVARLLDEGLPYLEIAKRTGASTTTVTRVAQWLKHGENGYQAAIDHLRDREYAAQKARARGA